MENCRKERTAKIIFRVKPEMKHFVKEFSEKQGLDISDFMRMMLEYFYMSYFTGSDSYIELKRKFLNMFPDNNDTQKK
jgi:hypothetical protein